jgi:hypothetical protein
LAISDWFHEGAPEIDPLTELQKRYLEAREGEVIPLLSPEERVNVRIVGYKEWISTLDKTEAMDLIGEIKDQKISKRVAERELFRRTRMRRIHKKQTLQEKLRKRDDGDLKNRKWWDTNPLKKDVFKRDR